MENIAALQEARDALKENIQHVNENIKKLTGRDPEESRRPLTNRRTPLKRNSFGRAGSNQQPPTKRTMNERRRWGNSAFANSNLDSGGEEEEEIKPAVHSSVVATGDPIEPLKRPKTDDNQAKKRNQRMFGMLLGTLKQFKQENQFKSEQDTKREEKLHKVEEKVEKDRENAIRERKELYQSRRDKQAELRKVEFRIEMSELVTELKAHYENMKDSIQLKSTPRIFFRPAQHNEKTLKLLEESKESFQDSLDQRVKEIEMFTEEDLYELRAQNRIHGKSVKDPIVIDAIQSARDLFAEDADIDKMEQDADMKTSKEKSRDQEVVVEQDILTAADKSEEVLTDEVKVEEVVVASEEVTERVVVDEGQALIINDDRKVELSTGEEKSADSRKVVAKNNYSVVDERVVELNSSVDIYDDLQLKADTDQMAE